MKKPLIGVVSKPLKDNFARYNQIVDDMRTELTVNSLHRGEIVNPGKYRVVARSDDDLIEGLEYPDAKFNIGVQWHPELLRKIDAVENGIFVKFIEAARGSGRK